MIKGINSGSILYNLRLVSVINDSSDILNYIEATVIIINLLMTVHYLHYQTLIFIKEFSLLYKSFNDSMNLKITERMLLKVKKDESSLSYFNDDHSPVIIKVIENNYKHRQKY